MNRYFTALVNDFPTNVVGRALLTVSAIVVAFWAILYFAVTIYAGGFFAPSSNFIFLPVAFATLSVAHVLARPAIRIHYKQL